MIENKLLEQLGWSKDLINEVNRISSKLDESLQNINKVKDSTILYKSNSGNSIRFNLDTSDTDVNIYYKKY
jgi:putative sterol carrier protein